MRARVVLHLLAATGLESIARSWQQLAGSSELPHVELLVVVPDETGRVRWIGPDAPATKAALDSPAAVESAATWLRQGGDSVARIYIFTGHGYGLDGLGGARPALSIAALSAALQRSRGTSKPLDLVGLDACSMATPEILTGLAPEASLVAASPDLSPSRGWPIAAMLAAIDAVETPDQRAVALAFIAPYSRAGRHFFDLSLLRTDRVAGAAAAIAELAPYQQLCTPRPESSSTDYLDSRLLDPLSRSAFLSQRCGLPANLKQKLEAAFRDATVGRSCRDRGCSASPISLSRTTSQE